MSNDLLIRLPSHFWRCPRDRKLILFQVIIYIALWDTSVNNSRSWTFQSIIRLIRILCLKTLTLNNSLQVIFLQSKWFCLIPRAFPFILCYVLLDNTLVSYVAIISLSKSLKASILVYCSNWSCHINSCILNSIFYVVVFEAFVW